MSFIATTRINEAGSEELESKRRVKAGYAWFLRSSKSGVRFGVRCGPHVSIILAAKSVKTGGEGRNRTRPAFHKPLEINCLNHHCCLDTKGVCDLSQVNSSRLFLTPFYSPPMRFAGTSAGTFHHVGRLATIEKEVEVKPPPPTKRVRFVDVEKLNSALISAPSPPPPPKAP
jgi:hypothetical protein